MTQALVHHKHWAENHFETLKLLVSSVRRARLLRQEPKWIHTFTQLSLSWSQYYAYKSWIFIKIKKKEILNIIYLQYFIYFTASVMITHVCMKVGSVWKGKKVYADDTVSARESLLFKGDERILKCFAKLVEILTLCFASMYMWQNYVDCCIDRLLSGTVGYQSNTSTACLSLLVAMHLF